jgi:Flp pilus assembly protein TadD
VLADVHLHSRDYLAKSIEEFEAILKTNPNHAASLRGLGYAYLQQHDFEKAGEYFRRSAQADSKDPRVHYYSALLMNEQGAFTRDPDKIAVMKKELETSIALDPNFADAYSLLAFARMSSGEQEQAVQALQKAVSISPRNESYQINLAMLYLSVQKTEQAKLLLSALGNSGNPAIAAQAHNLLAHIQGRRVGLPDGPVDTGIIHRLPAEHPGNPQTEREDAAKSEVQVIPASTPPKFLKGKLVKVDCSMAPGAFLTVVSGAKTWKMKVVDTNKAVVIGADNFSCDWVNQKVALNYRETADNEGTVVSVEIQ